MCVSPVMTLLLLLCDRGAAGGVIEGKHESSSSPTSREVPHITEAICHSYFRPYVRTYVLTYIHTLQAPRARADIGSPVNFRGIKREGQQSTSLRFGHTRAAGLSPTMNTTTALPRTYVRRTSARTQCNVMFWGGVFFLAYPAVRSYSYPRYRS